MFYLFASSFFSVQVKDVVVIKKDLATKNYFQVFNFAKEKSPNPKTFQ
jgi:hypothetical protein